jgi:hypothetical protein
MSLRTRTENEDNMFEMVLLPRVRRLQIQDVGPIRQADVTFSAGLNFICGEGGSGKTTLLKSIVVGVCNHLRARHFSSHTTGSIQLELHSKITRCHLSAVSQPDVNCADFAASDGAISTGKAAYASLTQSIANLTEDFALLFDQEVLGVMDLSLLAPAFRGLSVAKGQVIGVLPRSFSLRVIQERNISARLIQTGRHSLWPADSSCSVETTDI